MSSESTPKSSHLDIVSNAIASVQSELIDVSIDIHDHPEINYQEHHAAGVLSDSLESHGFTVERGVGGVETAFRATIDGGRGDGPTVAILAD